MCKDANRCAPPYPLFLKIEGRTCLVVGGGAVGERKARTLLRHGARVLLVARELTPWLEARRAEGTIRLAGAVYDKSQLDDVALVFAATSDTDLNRTVARDADESGIWCNMASDPELGSFIVPSVVENGPLSIAVSTTGFSPAIAKVLRTRLEKEFGAEWEFFVRLLGRLREIFKSRDIKEQDSRRVFSELAALPLVEWIRQGNGAGAFLKVSETCAPFLSAAELQPVWEDLWNHCFSS